MMVSMWHCYYYCMYLYIIKRHL